MLLNIISTSFNITPHLKVSIDNLAFAVDYYEWMAFGEKNKWNFRVKPFVIRVPCLGTSCEVAVNCLLRFHWRIISEKIFSTGNVKMVILAAVVLTAGSRFHVPAPLACAILAKGVAANNCVFNGDTHAFDFPLRHLSRSPRGSHN